jgi:hypothetical protein
LDAAALARAGRRNPWAYYFVINIRRRGVKLVLVANKQIWRTGMSQMRILDRPRERSASTEVVTLPPFMTRLAGAALALAIAGAHVADQGGVTAFTAPDWLGWAYRLIEVGGVLVAVTLLWPRLARLGWAAGVLLGIGPLAGFVASRTVGVPGDPGDVGNWSDWVGNMSLVIEAGLIIVSVGMLWGLLRRPSSTTDSGDRPAELARAGRLHNGTTLARASFDEPVRPGPRLSGLLGVTRSPIHR